MKNVLKTALFNCMTHLENKHGEIYGVDWTLCVNSTLYWLFGPGEIIMVIVEMVKSKLCILVHADNGHTQWLHFLIFFCILMSVTHRLHKVS